MSGTLLLTGAGGFVGAHLAEGLAALGWRVSALDRAFDAATRRRLGAARLVEGEVSASAMEGAGHGFDVLIHAAALTTPPEGLGLSVAAFVRLNLDPLLSAIEFASRGGARRLLFLSSSGVFEAGGERERPLDESAAPDAAHPYGVAKRMGELAMETLLPAAVRGLTLRLGPVFGPHEAARESRARLSPVATWIAEASAGRSPLVENALSRRDWTFAPDLAPAIDRLVRREATGLLHLTSGEAMDDAALAGRIARHHGLVARSAEPPLGSPRRPMVSRRGELADFPWTPIEAGLASLLPRKAAA